jgi:hypothetical protein
VQKKRLTAELLTEICTRLKAGAFDQVAVESLGVPFEVFQGWMRKGQLKGQRPLYRQLVEAVCQARAQARLLAEMKMRDEDTKVWLLQGPGRETAQKAGWGTGGRLGPAEDTKQHDQIWDLCTFLLEALAAFPEARAAAVEAVARWRPDQTDEGRKQQKPS